jgi:hypothetical protein
MVPGVVGDDDNAASGPPAGPIQLFHEGAEGLSVKGVRFAPGDPGASSISSLGRLGTP